MQNLYALFSAQKRPEFWSDTESERARETAYSGRFFGRLEKKERFARFFNFYIAFQCNIEIDFSRHRSVLNFGPIRNLKERVKLHILVDSSGVWRKKNDFRGFSIFTLRFNAILKLTFLGTEAS